jgi:hypothetical protein
MIPVCLTSRATVHPGHVGTTADSPAPDAAEAIRAISASARSQNHS